MDVLEPQPAADLSNLILDGETSSRSEAQEIGAQSTQLVGDTESHGSEPTSFSSSLMEVTGSFSSHGKSSAESSDDVIPCQVTSALRDGFHEERLPVTGVATNDSTVCIPDATCAPVPEALDIVNSQQSQSVNANDKLSSQSDMVSSVDRAVITNIESFQIGGAASNETVSVDSTSLAEMPSHSDGINLTVLVGEVVGAQCTVTEPDPQHCLNSTSLPSTSPVVAPHSQSHSADIVTAQEGCVKPDVSISSTAVPDCTTVASMGSVVDSGGAVGGKLDNDDCQTVYHVKWIRFKTNQVPIITQNDNGCCPLLAIVNTMFLLGKIKLPSTTELITSNQLMAHLADCIFDNVPKNITADSRLNYEQNMNDAIAIFPRLQTGLDVNVKFTGVSEFEYTPECIVFDLLNIPLYHGWLVDPQLTKTHAAIGSCSYNRLVEKIIVQKSSTDEQLVTEALLADEFLNSTASQLTYHGLSELSQTVSEDQMCVLFRNNHFSTLYKYKDELFVLVTDQGLLRESHIVWETLCNVEGDGHFVDSNFRTYRTDESSSKGGVWGTPPRTQPPEQTPLLLAGAVPSIGTTVGAATAIKSSPSQTVVPANSKEQIDHDYLLALSLEQDLSDVPADPSSWADLGPSAAEELEADRLLAARLQEEEDAEAAAAANAAAAQPVRPSDKPVALTGSGVASGGSKDSPRGKDKDKDKEKEKEKKESNCLIM